MQEIKIRVSSDVAAGLHTHLTTSTELANTKVSPPRENTHDPLERDELGAQPVAEIVVSFLTSVTAAAAYDLVKAAVVKLRATEKCEVVKPDTTEPEERRLSGESE